MTQKRQIDMFSEGRLVKMLISIKSYPDVSRIVNVPSVLSPRSVKNLKASKNVKRKPVTNHPSRTASHQERYLTLNTRQHIIIYVLQQPSVLAETERITDSRQTEYSRLGETGI